MAPERLKKCVITLDEFGGHPDLLDPPHVVLQTVLQKTHMVELGDFITGALMANRTMPDFQRVLGRFAAMRIQGILNHSFTANGKSYRLSDFLTSEKVVAMAYRAHILNPGSIVGNRGCQLPDRLGRLLAQHTTHTQARENASRQVLINVAQDDAQAHVTRINGWNNFPAQYGGATFTALTNNTISGTINSFSFASP